MKRALLSFLALVSTSVMLLSCSSSRGSGSTTTSGIAYRAFFSQQVNAGTAAAGIYIVDAQHDLRAAVAPISAGITPGKMVVTPSRAQTLVFSGYVGVGSDNVLTVINNTKESAAGGVALPGFTESIVVTPDSNTAYVAVPTATVVGQSPGVVKAISLGSVAFTGEVDIPAVRYLSINHSGTRLLGLSDNSNSVAVITPSNIGTQDPAFVLVSGFDHPVAAFFSSDDTTAYVVNCGAECGGNTASVQALDMNTNALGPFVQVDAATTGLMDGSTLYLAGTPVGGGACTGQTTAATSCGVLTTLDLTTMTVASTIAITDGTHDVIAMGANGQLFIGAHNCTELTGAEVRGCLSIYNSQSVAVGSVPPNAVMIPPAGGDVTGIQPIAKRTVVYVVQNGSLTIYDTTTDGLAPNPHNPNSPGQITNLIGDFYDVKTIDF